MKAKAKTEPKYKQIRVPTSMPKDLSDYELPRRPESNEGDASFWLTCIGVTIAGVIIVTSFFS